MEGPLYKTLRYLNLTILVVVICSCKQGEPIRFKQLSSDDSGIDFANNLIYGDTLSVLDFEYIFNGGGVAIADINSDGLQDIFFTGNAVSSELYLNKGNLKFEKITNQAGVSTSVWCNGVTMVDVNQDGFKDIFVCVSGTRKTPAYKRKNLLFINNRNQTFTESASAYGLAGTGHNIQATWLDYDHDGDLDVYILRNAFVEYSRNRARPKSVNGESSTTDQLYRNNGDKTFTDVSKEAGILIEGFGLGVQTCDLNEDGWPDIFVSNDFITNDLLYINNQDGTFSNKSASYFRHTTYNAMGNDMGDINNDGLIDLVEVDMLPADNYRWKVTIMGNTFDEFQNGIKFGYEYQYIRNTLQLNNGNNTFSEIGYLARIEATDWSWSPLFADVDNDGYKDLFITNGYRQDITNLDFIKFSERTLRMGTPDANKKERLDMLNRIPGIIVPNYLFKNNGDLTFKNISSDAGIDSDNFANGAAYADLDNDGDLDFVTNNIDQPASLFINQTNTDSSNYLRISFNGPENNREGIGAVIKIKSGDLKQTQYFTPFRGFLSSVEPVIHLGLGKHTVLDTVTVTWPDQKTQLLTQVKCNQLLKLSYANAVQVKVSNNNPSQTFFIRDYSDAPVHQENDFVDFKNQPLLPHLHSRNGPGIAVGDVDQDGLEDYYMSVATGQQGFIYIQKSDGSFVRQVTPVTKAESDQMGVLFFDPDSDGDLDLYITTGGSEFEKNTDVYKDHLFENDGNGNFYELLKSLPENYQSGSSVVAADYDHDGDPDLFVSGRVIPGTYPLVPVSTLMRNDSKPGKIKFTDVTEKMAPELLQIGMVTSALWTDTDKDGWFDLLLVGEYMEPVLFKNRAGEKLQKENIAGFKNHSGWWNSLVADDFDLDGDTDYIAGNLGLNSRYKASKDEPLCVYASDFDKNGSVDPVISMYIDGVNQSVHSWDDLVRQMTPIRSRFRTYEPYARADFEHTFTKDERSTAYNVCVQTFESSYIENLGNGEFKITALPKRTQFSPVFGMVATDFNNDAIPDLLAVGNSYATEVSTGRYDASIGCYLRGNGDGTFESVSVSKSGFFADQDAKGLVAIFGADRSLKVITGVNNGPAVVHQSKRQFNLFVPKAEDAYAIIKLQNGKQLRHEFYFGSTYLSASTRNFIIPEQAESIKIISFTGQERIVRK